MIPFGPRVDRAKYGGNDPCAVTFVRMQALGILSITSNLRDLRWCLSLLEQRPEVDASRIGCVGLSYGGRMSMLVSAVDSRIRIAAVSGAMNLMQERFAGRHSCGSQMIPGLLNYGDYAEIGSLIAPRPCVWETGSSDSLIVPGWEDRFRDRLQRAYVAAGVAEHLVYDRFEGGHRWSGQVAFSMFARELTPRWTRLPVLVHRLIPRYRVDGLFGPDLHHTTPACRRSHSELLHVLSEECRRSVVTVRGQHSVRHVPLSICKQAEC